MLCRPKLNACTRLALLLILPQVLLTSPLAVDARPFSFADLFQPYAPVAPYTTAGQPNAASNAYNYAGYNYAGISHPLLARNGYDVAGTGSGAGQVTTTADNGRTFVHIKQEKRRRRRRRRRPCRSKESRTYPNINFVYLEVNEQYDCTPAYGSYGTQGTHGTHGSHGSHGSHGTHGSHGSHGTSHGDGDDDEYDDIIDEYSDPPPVTSSNSHGSLASSPVYHAPVQQAAPANQPSGGPLGFFGQGGLFDISSGNQNQFVGVNPVQGDSYDDVRPVIEINVPGSLQDAVTWRPTNNLVGGIQNAVTGFVQQAVNRPERTLRQINREISSIFEPLTSWFF